MTNGNPFELDNIKADFLEHFSDLSIFTLSEGDLNPILFVRSFLKVFNMCGPDFSTHNTEFSFMRSPDGESICPVMDSLIQKFTFLTKSDWES